MQQWNIAETVEKAKRDPEAMKVVLEKLDPLLNKKSRDLFFMEKEDAYQELVISVIEAVNKIPDCSSDGGCLVYIKNAIDYKFWFLSEQNLRKERCEEAAKTDMSKAFVSVDTTEKSIFLEFMSGLMNDLTKQEKYIINAFVFYGLKNTEIAKNLNVTRQYVGKVKRRVFDKWKALF